MIHISYLMEEAVLMPPKRGRGRPRKVSSAAITSGVLEAAQEHSAESTPDLSTPLKRARGRPKGSTGTRRSPGFRLDSRRFRRTERERARERRHQQEVVSTLLAMYVRDVVSGSYLFDHYTQQI